MIRNSFFLFSLCLRTISSCLGNFHLIHTSITRRRCQCRWRGCGSGLVQLLGPTGSQRAYVRQYIMSTYRMCMCVCVCICVYVCGQSVLCGPSSFFFGRQLKVFRWQKLCRNLFCCVSKCPCGIYTFARVLTVCTSFSPASHTHRYTLINSLTNNVNSAFVCCFFSSIQV